MLRTRLDLEARDLAEQIAQATDTQKRAVCLAVVKLVVQRMAVDEPIVDLALRLLKNGIYNDEGAVAALKRLADECDNRYLDAHDQYETGRGDEATYRELFGRFAAVSAVLMAFKDDPFEAVSEAIYEASAAIGLSEPESLARAMLSKA